MKLPKWLVGDFFQSLQRTPSADLLGSNQQNQLPPKINVGITLREDRPIAGSKILSTPLSDEDKIPRLSPELLPNGHRPGREFLAPTSH